MKLFNPRFYNYFTSCASSFLGIHPLLLTLTIPYMD